MEIHITDFFVATVMPMPCYNMTEEKQVLDMLHYVHGIFASFSILGSLSIIIYALCKRIVNTSEVRPLFHLALADLGLAVCWLLGALLWNLPFQEPGIQEIPFCNVLQAITECDPHGRFTAPQFYYQDASKHEMFNLITFFLTVNYALNVYLRLKDRLNKAQKLTLLHTMTSMKWIMRSFYIISWLVPILVMIPVVIAYNHLQAQDPCTECVVLFFKPSVHRNGSFKSWLWARYGAIFFVVSLLLSLVAIVTLYVLSARAYRKIMKKNVWTNRQRKALIDLCKRISLYISVFVICWTPALALNTMEVFNGKAPLTDCRWLYVLQGITAPSQGFLNCLIYGWTRTTFRLANATQDTRPILGQRSRIYGTSLFPQVHASPRQHPIQSAVSSVSDDTSVDGMPTSPLEFQSP